MQTEQYSFQSGLYKEINRRLILSSLHLPLLLLLLLYIKRYYICGKGNKNHVNKNKNEFAIIVESHTEF